MPKIAIAIGHNYAAGDKGAFANDASEADVTKAIIDALIAKGIPGYELVKVPEKLGIAARNKWVNDRQKDLAVYLEFHLDSASPTATGVTTYFVGGNTWAEGEAKQFQKEYTRVTGLAGRGVKADTTNRWGRLGAIRDIKIFGLLIELGFISNVIDLAVVRKRGVEAVAAGIQAMFNG